MQYIFDMDGTLIDSMPTFGRVMVDYLRANGVTYPPDVVERVTPLGFSGTAEYFIGELGVRQSREEMGRVLCAAMERGYREEIPAKAHVWEVLTGLHEAGAKLYVLTASPRLFWDPCLTRLGLISLFTQVWCCDEFGLSKADPDLYVRVAELLKTRPEECMFFDDNPLAAAAAATAGMHTVGVYDPSSAGREDEMRRICERYICSWDEF